MTAAGKTVALVVAAGSGSRAGGGTPKQYRPIGGKPVLRWAVEPFVRHPRIDAVRVVIGANHDAYAADALEGLDVGEPVPGANERAFSVINGLEALPPDTSRVLIHDAARPFCPPAVIDRLLDALEGSDAAVPVLPVPDTVAKLAADDLLGDRVDRSDLARVQTPQAFVLETLVHAYQDWRSPPPTDESAYLRAKRIPVAVVPGDVRLEKLTYEEDFERAERLLAARTSVRTGFGFDVHAFAPGDGVWLGGVRIPHDRGLTGHSDADVALHALTDALLGAVAAGDIGEHFPPTDVRWSGASSSIFLEHARDLVLGLGGRILHCDLTIVCEAPRIGPHRASIRSRIAELLRVSEGRISVKATTSEGLGFTGRGEGMAAQAVATVSLPDEP